MEKIGLVVKKDDRAVAEAENLKLWLTDRGLRVVMDEPRDTTESSPDREGLAEGSLDVDLVVVLGGDGTLLYAARTMGKNGIPLLGVNMGGLGFMTEISLPSLRPTLEAVLAGRYKAEARMMLAVEVRRHGETVTRQSVLNDAVINKGALARILNLSVKVDGTELTTYRADGLIISTPTGSTAYNLAAGGPIVHPVHESIILTPICPFTLSNRPLILPRTVLLEIRVDPEASDVILTADGQVSCPLEPDDVIMVKKAEQSVFLIKNPYKNYFEILRTKLHWG